MRNDFLFGKGVAVTIIGLFLCSSLIPSISGITSECSTGDSLTSTMMFEVDDEATVTLYTFNILCMMRHEVSIPADIVISIFESFEELKDEFACNPFSKKTRSLEKEFLTKLKETGFLSNRFTKERFSLLLPRFLNQRLHKGDASKSSSSILNGWNETLYLCSMASSGIGWIFPPALLPRPRMVFAWTAFSGESSIVEMITGKWIQPSGAHMGISLGFMGIGFSFAFPGQPPYYVFYGYSLTTTLSYGE